MIFNTKVELNTYELSLLEDLALTGKLPRYELLIRLSEKGLLYRKGNSYSLTNIAKQIIKKK